MRAGSGRWSIIILTAHRRCKTCSSASNPHRSRREDSISPQTGGHHSHRYGLLREAHHEAGQVLGVSGRERNAALLHHEDLLVGMLMQLRAASRRRVYDKERDADITVVVSLELVRGLAVRQIGQVE